MSLDTYRRKRDFAKTPEPSGGDGPERGRAPRGDRRYVVQRHRATRLHYDFRLEIDGVLMSWAVPKGPTLDPGEKRMAVHVEDHPLDYFDFEGVIPRGQYGGGDVIVWDWGHFEPEETKDPGAAVRRGELKFSLEGERLKGRFTLVRTGGRGGGSRYGGGEDGKEQWLLIHKKDDAAVAGWDAEHHPTSVKSGRTNDEVKAGMPAVWDSGAPAASAEIDLSKAVTEPMPEFVPPMKATLATDPFTDGDWLFELKWDGYRVEAVVDRGRVRLWTRNRQDAGRYFPDLVAPPTWIDARQAIVDGEVVALGENGEPDFSLLQDVTGILLRDQGRDPSRPRPSAEERAEIPLAYQVFDLLYLDGRSLLDVPLEARKRLLRSVLREHDIVRYGSHIEADGDAFYEAAGNRGLEGIVAKHRQSRYEPGRRSRSWLKLKVRREQEFVVGGYAPGKGNAKDLGALILGVYEDGALRHVGQVGSGFSARTRKELSAKLDELRRDTAPFAKPPKLPGARWVEPEMVIRAEFAEWTTDGLLRQSAFKGVELAKDPRTVARETATPTETATQSAERAATRSTGSSARKPPAGKPSPAKADEAHRRTTKGADDLPPQAPTQDELAALEAMRKEGRWEVGGREVALSNLDKVLFPEDGFTKRDLIRYYVSVAPVMLPYLRGRALNLWRWPNGIGGSHFWQKEIPKHAPDWIARWSYPDAESSEAHTYIVADSVATMAWLGNHATIDMHPWTSRTEAHLRPTYALIDVDPGAKTSWEEVLLLTRLYRTALEHLGVQAFPKVTGKRGIQAWIPVKPIYSFDDTRTWVEQLSRAIGQTVPDLVSWEWEKTSRRGLARLDYTQNAVNKTLVAPYAVRPAPGAPVSAPITWDELEDPDLRPNRWTIRNVLERLDARGDLFSPVFSLEQELPPL